MLDTPILIADIGGTNARFAISTHTQPYYAHAHTFLCADFADAYAAIRAYLEQLNITQLGGLCFAIAGPIIDDQVQLTNNHWTLDRRVLQQKFAIEQVYLLNDFTAIAHSLATLRDEDLLAVGGAWATPNNHDNLTLGVLGPGSGLGIAGLIKQGAYTHPLTTEGGHVSFAPVNTLQAQILTILQQQFEHVCAEHLLSGPGLINLYQALCKLNNTPHKPLNATEIAQAGSNANDPICQQVMAMFFEILGQVAGDLALTLGAFQGIFIGGGITPRYAEQITSSAFRRGFESKGRQQALMMQIPTWLITRDNPGLVGCSAFINAHLAR